MAEITKELKTSIKGSLGLNSNDSVSLLNIISKNFLDLTGMARDLNVASQNVKELVRVMGEEARDSEDMHLLKEDEKERKLKVEIDKLSPTPVEEEKKKPSLLSKLAGKGFAKFKKSKLGQKTMKGMKKLSDMKKQFTGSKFMKAFQKYFALAAVIGLIFVAFKDTFVEWVSSLWDAIKESFDKFVEQIKEWFNDIVQPILDKVKEFLQPMIDAISEMFNKIGEYFVGFFNQIKDVFQPAIEFVAKIWNKFMSMVDDFKAWLKPKVETAMKIPGVGKLIPEFLKKWLKIGETPQKVTEEEDAAEKKKLDRQQKEAVDTERVKTQEKKAQYTGEDEIVRKRHGIEDKTMTMRAEDRKKSEEAAKKKEAPAAAPPSAAPTPTPAPEAPPAAAPGAEAKPTPEAAAPPAKKPSEGETKPKKLGSESGKKAMIGAMDSAKITDPTARAAIMAQVGHESGNFTTLSENLNYRGATLTKLFPKKFSGQSDADSIAAGGPEKVAERIYGGRMGNAPEGGGDGFKYRGRGFIQLTGKQNYTKFGYSSNPDDVAKPDVAAESAIKYMMGYKGDWNDIKAVTKFVNGGYIGLEDRAKHFKEYLNDPEIIKVGAVSSSPSGGTIGSSSSSVAADQRGQQKPSTPNVINAPTNNTTVTNKTQVAATPQKNTSQVLTSRVA